VPKLLKQKQNCAHVSMDTCQSVT